MLPLQPGRYVDVQTNYAAFREDTTNNQIIDPRFNLMLVIEKPIYVKNNATKIQNCPVFKLQVILMEFLHTVIFRNFNPNFLCLSRRASASPDPFLHASQNRFQHNTKKNTLSNYHLLISANRNQQLFARRRF